MSRLSFKEYLASSKDTLRSVVSSAPISKTEYEIVHYCNLPLGETEEDKFVISLRPKQTMVVEWEYTTPTTPTVINISFVGATHIDESESFQTFWPSKKLQMWLARHSKEKKV